MADKEKLKLLVDLIKELISVEGNGWLVDAILERIQKVEPIEAIAGHSVIQSIHEYCLEKVIDFQAREFYKDFKIDEIKPQIVSDFKKMEHERRRNDFSNFSLCLYQQIENITNYLFDNYINPNWKSLLNNPAIKTYNRITKSYEFQKKEGKNVENLIFRKSDPEKWYAYSKLRVVLYYYYFGTEVTKNDYEFNTMAKKFDYIYQVRNTIHRGGPQKDYQKNILKTIEGFESQYYFKFYGLLVDFVERINQNVGMDLSKSTTSKYTTESPKKKPVPKNTIGNLNTQPEEPQGKLKSMRKLRPSGNDGP